MLSGGSASALMSGTPSTFPSTWRPCVQALSSTRWHPKLCDKTGEQESTKGLANIAALMGNTRNGEVGDRGGLEASKKDFRKRGGERYLGRSDRMFRTTGTGRREQSQVHK